MQSCRETGCHHKGFVNQKMRAGTDTGRHAEHQASTLNPRNRVRPTHSRAQLTPGGAVGWRRPIVHLMQYCFFEMS
jgi:hypothetical protein